MTEQSFYTRARVATCRIQLRNGVGFDEVIERLPYLHDLGISHLYLSPIFLAAPDSSHGYDCIDPDVVDPVLGGETRFTALCDALADRRMGLILDIVPNHLGVGFDNPYWRDLLRHGSRAESASMFDVDWRANAGGTPGRVYLPILGQPLAQVLAAGELHIVRDGEPEMRYFEHRLPLADTVADESVETCLERQHWRLGWWRSANSLLNWRRFFDITELAGVRVEDPAVFAKTHRKLMALCRHPAVQGLRIDHIDGLADPGGYLDALRQAWLDERDDPPWILVEKILAPDETLPVQWPVAGTTGYEALNRILAVFIDPDGYAEVEAAWRDFGGSADNFERELAAAKREILTNNLAAELGRLTTLLSRSACMDFPVATIREALIGMVIATDRYRSYGASDTRAFDAALARVDWDALAGPGDDTIARSLPDALAVAMAPGSVNRQRFEQLSAPAMAKALEDTTFYRWFPLLARNEVGNEPGAALPEIGQLHAQFAAAASATPFGLLATTTHDTKRGEDGRIRLALLSHPLADWRAQAADWLTLTQPHRRFGLPDLKTVYFIFQTLVSVWPMGAGEATGEDVGRDPVLRERLTQYFEKAFREGKRRTSWLEPDTRFESQVNEFVTACLDDVAFCTQVHRYVDHLDRPARALTLAQTVLKLTLPGIPDIYHGSERQDLSLVDPDNRRPVDWAALAARIGRPVTRWWEPGAKQWVIERILLARQRCPGLFSEGGYRALTTEPQQAPVFAFERSDAQGTLLVAVTHRFPGQAPLPGSMATVQDSGGGPAANASGTRRSQPLLFDDAGAGDVRFAADAAAGGRWVDLIQGADRNLSDRPFVHEVLSGWPVAVLFRSA